MRRRSDKDSGPTESTGERQPLAIGTRVRTYTSPNPEERPFHDAGVIIDDFGGETLATPDHYGRDWALTKRWGIALDNGSLVFRNDTELELEG